MSENDKVDTEKLETFTDAVINEAIEESLSIAKELRLQEKDIIEKAREDLEVETERYKKTKMAEIFAEESRRVSARMMEDKYTLLKCREDFATEAFKEAREKIITFSNSAEYLPHLKRLLSKAVSILGSGCEAEVALRSEDMKYAEELSKSQNGIKLSFIQGDFDMGGLCVNCREKQRRIDMSFDSALGDMVGHFAELTGLRIDE